MKLLLTSNGLTSPELEQAFKEITGDKEGLRVAHIPTAGDPIEWVKDPADGKTKARLTKIPDYETKPEETKVYREWKGRGHDLIIVSLRDYPTKVREQLESAQVISVGGGDSNWLLDWAKVAKLDIYLKELLDRGVVYIGGSAGSVLLQPDIGLMWWNPGDWEDHVGLNVVDFMIAPHQKEAEIDANMEKHAERRKFMQTIMPYPWKIYFLLDGQAVKVDGEKIEHIGHGVKKWI